MLFGVLGLLVGVELCPNGWWVFGAVGGVGLVPSCCWVGEDGWCGSGALAAFGVFDGVVVGGGVGRGVPVVAGGVVVDWGDDGADGGIWLIGGVDVDVGVAVGGGVDVVGVVVGFVVWGAVAVVAVAVDVSVADGRVVSAGVWAGLFGGVVG
ncbi:hypothetical protein [Nocardia sp. NPDC057272]|uniref:hypothetical protein n=1 Tax=Nocardia sp. NPDC057272 TaxID=3346079 RepID=UPI00362A8753